MTKCHNSPKQEMPKSPEKRRVVFVVQPKVKLFDKNKPLEWTQRKRSSGVVQSILKRSSAKC